MAKKTVYPTLNCWENRWQQPTPKDLFNEIDPNRLNAFKAIDEFLIALPKIERRISWLGDEWKWCFEYLLEGFCDPQQTDGLQAFAYIVPLQEFPIICLPFFDDFLSSMEHYRRLNRYIRENIQSAKLAVNVIWAEWSPIANTEVEHLSSFCQMHYNYLCSN